MIELTVVQKCYNTWFDSGSENVNTWFDSGS